MRDSANKIDLLAEDIKQYQNSYEKFKRLAMPIIEFRGLIFEWHDAKFEMVYKGRQITFEEACSTFFDDYAVTIEDIGHYSEQRLLTTGMSKDFRLLTVVWVESNDTFRLITAFEPTKDQQRRYEYAKRNN